MADQQPPSTTNPTVSPSSETPLGAVNQSIPSPVVPPANQPASPVAPPPSGTIPPTAPANPPPPMTPTGHVASAQSRMPHISKKKIMIGLVIIFILILGGSLFLIRSRQTIKSQAEPRCAPPYPLMECNFPNRPGYDPNQPIGCRAPDENQCKIKSANCYECRRPGGGIFLECCGEQPPEEQPTSPPPPPPTEVPQEVCESPYRCIPADQIPPDQKDLNHCKMPSKTAAGTRSANCSEGTVCCRIDSTPVPTETKPTPTKPPQPTVTPTPGVCPKPETVTNIKVSCPSCK